MLNDLKDLCEKLDKIYDKAQAGYNQLDALEEEIAKLEGEYNTQLYRYAQEVGLANIPQELLDYTAEEYFNGNPGTVH